MADFEVKPETLQEYAQVLDGLQGAVSKIEDYMRSTACDTSGFTGLFYVLRPVVDLVANLYGDTLKFGHSRLTSMSQGIQSVAKAYADHDADVAKLLHEIYEQLENGGGGRDPGIVGTGGPGDHPPIGLPGSRPQVPDFPPSPPVDFPPISDDLPRGPQGAPPPEPGGRPLPTGTQGLPD